MALEREEERCCDILERESKLELCRILWNNFLKTNFGWQIPILPLAQ
jgi:thymidylate synthase ThyX